MSDIPRPVTREEQARRQAREAVVQGLGLISMIIWVSGVLAFLIWVYPARPFKPSSGMLAGLVMLAIAALPWLAYRPLVGWRLRAQCVRRGLDPSR